MLPIRYVHREFIFTEGKEPDTTLTIGHGTNPLVPSTNGAYLENYISYADPMNRYISRFDCGYTHKPEGYHIRNRILPYILFKYCLSGSLAYNGLTMREGDAIFVEPYLPFNSVPLEGGTEALWCVWEGDLMTHVAEKMRAYRSDTVYHLGTGEPLRALFEAAIYNRFYNVLDINAYVSGFTDQLFSFLPAIDSPDGERTANPLVKRALAIIEREYRTITVDALAGLLYVDPCHLARSFRREMGITPKQHLTQVKLTYAEYYLTNTTHTIQQIADMVGYASYTSFYLAFRQRFGLSPEEYRRAYTSQG
ncbi:MAG: helix-turn-helix transcriptional regulator [Clostridia bacterium]|nr:helix-turn-helix transcriptional regulator [Clostridia bacterium]